MITLIIIAGVPNAKQNKWELQVPLVPLTCVSSGKQEEVKVALKWSRGTRRAFWNIFCPYELFLCFEPSRSQESALGDPPLGRRVGLDGLQRSFQPQLFCDAIILHTHSLSLSSLFIPCLSLLILPPGTN